MEMEELHRIARPGSVINLIERVDAVPELIGIAKEIDAEEIVFLNHSDCLMYRGQPPNRPFDDLREIMDIMKEDLPGIELKAMYADIRPMHVTISEVSFETKGSFSLSPLTTVARLR